MPPFELYLLMILSAIDAARLPIYVLSMIEVSSWFVEVLIASHGVQQDERVITLLLA